jgi:hypothetical protein
VRPPLYGIRQVLRRRRDRLSVKAGVWVPRTRSRRATCRYSCTRPSRRSRRHGRTVAVEGGGVRRALPRRLGRPGAAAVPLQLARRVRGVRGGHAPHTAAGTSTARPSGGRSTRSPEPPCRHGSTNGFRADATAARLGTPMMVDVLCCRLRVMVEAGTPNRSRSAARLSPDDAQVNLSRPAPCHGLCRISRQNSFCFS